MMFDVNGLDYHWFQISLISTYINLFGLSNLFFRDILSKNISNSLKIKFYFLKNKFIYEIH